ncbi:hypothetical protein RvY_05178 [Ramazzottius varieornatus]|uniref:Uncharacterized protein n=1 Tax=Ramazzottius varieornatus TaxID=947166 RepID=A0A1D1UXR9_RAMVA|nr:hypothetical protein RvY_05178 [Ramazzottius varieornatus]
MECGTYNDLASSLRVLQPISVFHLGNDSKSGLPPDGAPCALRSNCCLCQEFDLVVLESGQIFRGRFYRFWWKASSPPLGLHRHLEFWTRKICVIIVPLEHTSRSLDDASSHLGERRFD